MTLDATPGLEPGRAPPRSLSQARSPGPDLPRVLVVGGGFSGVATAVHLSLQAPGPVVIDVVEPQPHLGAGLAYSTADPAHRINVPSSRMGLFPDDEGHFDRWLGQADYLADDPDAATATGDAYPRRLTFGRYVEACVGALGAGRPPVRHLRDRALGVAAAGSGYAVRLASGDVRQADVVVLTPSNPAPEPPAALAAALAGHPRFVADPWAEDALAPIRPSDRVLIVGTGLTMADIVASLDRRGHAGPITAISRRGLVSQGHTEDAREPFGDFAASPAASARDLLRRVRRTLLEAEAAGRPWQHVLDQLRRQGTPVWAALPPAERRRFLRHLRPYWDTRRYRIAPQVEAVLRRRIADGALAILAASLGRVDRAGPVIRVGLRPRGSPPAAALAREFDAVVVATGPAHGRVVETSPFLASLAAGGLVRPDPLGLGLLVDDGSRAVDRHGRAQDGLLVAGPLARGTFGELMGAPEIARHAAALAGRIATQLVRHQAGKGPLE